MTGNLDKKDLVMKKKSDGLRSMDTLVNHRTFFLALILVCFIIFGLLTFAIYQQGALVQWDIAMVNSMHNAALASPDWVKNFIVIGDYIGLHGYISISALLALYFLFKRYWKEFFLVLITTIGQSLIFLSLTNLIARPRPVFSENIGQVIKYFGFPSGHMMSTVIYFSFLAYFFVPKISSRFWKYVFIITAILLVVFVGFSRFFMGAHYLTDIVVGATVGIVWFCLMVMAFESFSKKGDKKYVK